jgi:hypothetical protein
MTRTGINLGASPAANSAPSWELRLRSPDTLGRVDASSPAGHEQGADSGQAA